MKRSIRTWEVEYTKFTCHCSQDNFWIWNWIKAGTDLAILCPACIDFSCLKLLTVLDYPDRMCWLWVFSHRAAYWSSLIAIRWCWAREHIKNKLNKQNCPNLLDQESGLVVFKQKFSRRRWGRLVKYRGQSNNILKALWSKRELFNQTHISKI